MRFLPLPAVRGNELVNFHAAVHRNGWRQYYLLRLCSPAVPWAPTTNDPPSPCPWTGAMGRRSASQLTILGGGSSSKIHAAAAYRCSDEAQWCGQDKRPQKTRLGALSTASNIPFH